VAVAAYCIICGTFDSFGHYRGWFFPNAALFYGLFGSVFAFPLLAAIWIAGSQQRHSVTLLVSHVTLSIGQLFLGLFPLVS
jgi:hypothetical protein